MKRVVLLTSLLMLCLCFPLTALADSWVCPLCGNTNTDNFCENDAQPRPAQTAAPVAAADSWVCPLCGNINTDNFCENDRQPRPVQTDITVAETPVAETLVTAKPITYAPTPTPKPANKQYGSEAAFMDVQPHVEKFVFEDYKVAFTFDKAIDEGSKVLFKYYNKDKKYVETEISIANGTDRVFSFYVEKSWIQDESSSIEIRRYDYQEEFLFTNEVFVYDNKVLEYHRIPSIGKNDFSEMYLYVWENYSTVIHGISFRTDSFPDIELYKRGEDGLLEFSVSCNLYDGHLYVSGHDNSTNYYYDERKKDDCTVYKRYAEEHLPIWQNGQRLIPKFY